MAAIVVSNDGIVNISIVYVDSQKVVLIMNIYELGTILVI